MKTAVHPFESLAESDPSFERLGPTEGRIQIDSTARRAEIQVEEDWLTATLPLSGGEKTDLFGFDLLRRQPLLLGPVKFGLEGSNRYSLIGEIPLHGPLTPEALRNRFGNMKEGLRRGLALFEAVSLGKNFTPDPEEEIDAASRFEQIGAILKEMAGEAWQCRGGRYERLLEERNYTVKMEIRIGPAGKFSLQSPLVAFQMKDLSDGSKQGLARFLIAVHRRIRLVRVSIIQVGDGEGHEICLEVVAGDPVIHPSLLAEAISSVTAAARWMALELRALLDPEVATAYLKHHEIGEAEEREHILE